MTEQIYGNIDRISKLLHLELSSTELAELAEKENFSSEAVISIGKLFTHLEEKKKSSIVTTILKTSRLPLTKPKTFSNFDFSRISGDNVDSLKNIQSLSAVYSHRNLAFIGPAGTGKTHLAQAFGYECCLHGMKCYFIKMSELGEKFSVARRTGTVSKVLTSLVRPSCLIIDEVGHCTFDVENTRLFFDLIDRRYQKEGNYNM
ncbi:MAG: ATP-binding protein, partial [Sphaerochaetaceae bacterium]|nr:ATP-binding protein [Sphaerochaetaceae bacterium]